MYLHRIDYLLAPAFRKIDIASCMAIKFSSFFQLTNSHIENRDDTDLACDSYESVLTSMLHRQFLLL